MGSRDGGPVSWIAKDVQDANLFEQALFGRRRRSGSRSVARSLISAPEDVCSEVPIGKEDRVQVRARARNPSTRLFPFNTISLVERGVLSSGTRRRNGTGTLITPQVTY